MTNLPTNTMPTTDTSSAGQRDNALLRGQAARLQWRAWAASVVAALALGGIVLVGFGQCWSFGFLAIDDGDNFLHNPYLRPLEPARLRVIWTEPYWGLYTPVTSTVWGLEMFFAEDGTSGQIDARWLHGTSLVLHVWAAWLVWLVLARLIEQRAAAWLGAALFAAHPIQTEAVCWASETKGLLAGVFGFWAIWHYCRFASPRGLESDEVAARRAVWQRAEAWHYAMGTVLYVLALLSKPSAAAIVLMVAVLDVGLLRRRWRDVATALVPWLLLALALMLVTRDAQGGEKVAAVVPLWQRPLVAADAIVFYLRKIVWPEGLGPDYGRTPIQVVASGAGYVAMAVIAGVLIVAAWLPGRRWWLVSLGLLVAGLTPVLGFVPFAFQDHSTVADRYAYLAMLGPALAVGRFAEAAIRKGGYVRAVFVACAVVAVVLLLGQSQRQTDTWRDDVHWAQRAVQINPASLAGNEVLAQIADAEGRHAEAMERRRQQIERHPASPLALVYLGRALLRQGDVDEAVQCFRRAMSRHPDSPAVEQWLARGLMRQGELRAAIAHFERALRRSGRNPGDDALWIQLGEAYARLGDRQQALAVLQQAVEQNPFSAPLYNRLGRVLHQLGRTDEAIVAFRNAVRLADDSAVARNNLGVAYMKKGEMARAAEQFRLAVQADPRHTESLKNWCLVLDRLGQRDEAIKICRRALEQDPHWRKGHYLLASRMVTHPDATVRGSVSALEAARALCRETNYREPQALDILAAALAASGRFEQAADTASQAVAIYRRLGHAAQARAAAERLETYRRKALAGNGSDADRTPESRSGEPLNDVGE